MAATIQTIQKPTRARALDTSGNNNHGQIYSGRGLEFDGVSDYLDAGDVIDMGANSLTLAIWAKGNTSSVHGSHLLTKQANYNANVLGYGLYWRHSEDRIVFNVGDGTDGNRIEYDLEANTWYRFVGTYNSSTGVGVLYVNGVQVGTATDTDIGNLDNSENLRLGGTSVYFDGMMSDGQIWDAVWTADDALYDYNNPEQLALNRGGTSLTESNLKIWYPMQDGHRGQQSFILDGANTGLDTSNITTPNLSDNGDYDGNDDSNWTLDTSAEWTVATNTSTSFGATTDSDISGATTASFYISSSNSEISANLPIGNYKITGTLSTTGTLPNTEARLRWYSTGSVYTDSDLSAGDFVIYGNIAVVNGNTHFRFTTSTEGHNFTLSNVKVTPVNAKNHATTVFYGDELYTAANAVRLNSDGTENEVNASTGIMKIHLHLVLQELHIQEVIQCFM